LIILGNLSQITKHTLNAVRGLPQSVIKLANDPFNYFKYPCNYEMLKEFEWRFFCKAS
jgi:hypothetical protein